MYQYTLLKMDGTKEDLGISKKKELSEMYKILDCQLVEVIPDAYYEGFGRVTMWGDEEGRFNENNTRNPFFKVLAPDYDVVGNILMEKKV